MEDNTQNRNSYYVMFIVCEYVHVPFLAIIVSVLAIMALVSGVVGATLTAEFPENGLSLISTNTANSREQVEYFALIHGDDAYNLMENGDITPEERTGLYLMRARIDQAEFKEKQDLVRK